MFIATLIAADRLTEQVVRAAGRKLMDMGCGPDPWEWIDAGSAATIAFQWQLQRAREVLAGAFPGVDAVVQGAGGLRKRLLVADMDSTMITVECIDELADYAGVGAAVAAITECAMRGELDFAAALDARVALLGGLPEAVLDECYRARVRATPGAATLVRTMRAHGANTLLISGGFTFFADRVAADLGFDGAEANVLEIADGALTGRVLPPIVDGARKAEALRERCGALGLNTNDVLAIGDGANDLSMVEAAGLGVAYRGKPVLEAAADAAIRFNDLTALLWAQGYARSGWTFG